jgi:PhzF family phenazine biosynthesis protein
MQSVTIPIVNAFVDGDQGGNPAGIVLNAERFDQVARQAIATQVGLSETAFVSASSIADIKLTFFTPARQIAQCGHATIATFSYLAQQGLLTKTHSSMETIDGPRAIHMDGDRVFMQQTAPTYTAPESLEPKATTRRFLQSLGLATDDLIDGLTPIVVNTGHSFLIIPLRTIDSVQRAVPNLPDIDLISRQLGLAGYYIFSPETQQPGRDAATRMFAPYYGIAEEAATGMAAGTLACYLHDYLRLKKTAFLIEQGHLMHPTPSPSLLTARLDVQDGKITGLMIGGKAKVSHVVKIVLKFPR